MSPPAQSAATSRKTISKYSCAISRSLKDSLANLRCGDFGCDHHAEDRDEDHGRAIPLEEIECGVERHADAARADQTEHRRFAHVDVPAEENDAPEGRTPLGPVTLERNRQPRRAARLQRLDAAAIGFLERLAEEL